MSFLLAVEAKSVQSSHLERWIFRDYRIKFLLCYFLVLTIRWFVPRQSTSVTNQSLLASIRLMIWLSHVHLTVSPILRRWEIGQCWKSEIAWLKHTSDVLKLTIGTIRTKSKHVIFTYRHWFDLMHAMPKLALISAKFAEATLIIRTWLLLFAWIRILFLRVSVNTLFLDVAMTILLIEFTNWYSVFFISMQILTCISLPTGLFEPMHAYFLLDLFMISSISHRFDYLFYSVDVHVSFIASWLLVLSPLMKPVLPLIITLLHDDQN